MRITFSWIVNIFTKTSSLDGLFYVGHSKHLFARCLFACTLLASLAIFIYRCVLLSEQFYARHTVTNVKIVHQTQYFPAVTICSINPYQKSKIAQMSKGIKKALQAYSYTMQKRRLALDSQPVAKVTSRTRRKRAPSAQNNKWMCNNTISGRFYAIGFCMNQYYSCTGDWMTTYVCPTNEYFDSKLELGNSAEQVDLVVQDSTGAAGQAALLYPDSTASPQQVDPCLPIWTCNPQFCSSKADGSYSYADSLAPGCSSYYINCLNNATDKIKECPLGKYVNPSGQCVEQNLITACVSTSQTPSNASSHVTTSPLSTASVTAVMNITTTNVLTSTNHTTLDDDADQSTTTPFLTTTQSPARTTSTVTNIDTTEYGSIHQTTWQTVIVTNSTAATTAATVPNTTTLHVASTETSYASAVVTATSSSAATTAYATTHYSSLLPTSSIEADTIPTVSTSQSTVTLDQNITSVSQVNATVPTTHYSTLLHTSSMETDTSIVDTSQSTATLDQNITSVSQINPTVPTSTAAMVTSSLTSPQQNNYTETTITTSENSEVSLTSTDVTLLQTITTTANTTTTALTAATETTTITIGIFLPGMTTAETTTTEASTTETTYSSASALLTSPVTLTTLCSFNADSDNSRDDRNDRNDPNDWSRSRESDDVSARVTQRTASNCTRATTTEKRNNGHAPIITVTDTSSSAATTDTSIVDTSQSTATLGQIITNASQVNLTVPTSVAAKVTTRLTLPQQNDYPGTTITTPENSEVSLTTKHVILLPTLTTTTDTATTAPTAATATTKATTTTTTATATATTTTMTTISKASTATVNSSVEIDNLPLDFDIDQLTPEQVTALEIISQTLDLQSANEAVAVQAKTQQAILAIAAILEPNDLRAISYNIDEIIIGCVFKEQPCDLEKDFVLVQDPNYGNCYTFNPTSGNSKFYISRSGSNNGLRMIVSSDTTDYLTTTASHGVKVVIHDQDDYPLPEVFGTSAPTGMSTSFAVRKTTIERLPAPYGKCVAQKFSDYIYPKAYSVEGCFHSCYQRAVVEECGCADPRFPVPPDRAVLHCDPFRLAQSLCLSNYTLTRGDYNAVKNCTCAEACKEFNFHATSTSALWPTRDHAHCDALHKKPIGENTTCLHSLKELTAQIEVHLQSLEEEFDTEAPAYDNIKYLTDIAQELNMWLSFTSVVGVEFLILFTQLLLLYCCGHEFNDPKPTKHPVAAKPGPRRPSLEPIQRSRTSTMNSDEMNFRSRSSTLVSYVDELPNQMQHEDVFARPLPIGDHLMLGKPLSYYFT